MLLCRFFSCTVYKTTFKKLLVVFESVRMSSQMLKVFFSCHGSFYLKFHVIFLDLVIKYQWLLSNGMKLKFQNFRT